MRSQPFTHCADQWQQFSRCGGPRKPLSAQHYVQKFSKHTTGILGLDPRGHTHSYSHAPIAQSMYCILLCPSCIERGPGVRVCILDSGPPMLPSI